MRGSFLLGRILGINVYIHFSFFFIFIWRAYTAYTEEGRDIYGVLFECAIVAGVFACVLMHEYGHALAARKYGIPTKQITLLPIGGVAQLQRMPQKPKQELWVAIAGPLVNVAIALILLPIVLLQFPPNHFLTEAYIDILIDSFTGRMLIVNIVLLLFNLLPAFPMDGGRVLRALLGFWLTFKKATTIAARVGQLMAIGFIIAGFYFNFFLILIGLFVIFGAEMELRMARKKYLRFGFSVQEALVLEPIILQAEDTIPAAVAKLISNNIEEDFLVAEGEEISGVVNREKLLQNLDGTLGNTLVQDLMQTEIASFTTDDSLDEILQTMRLQNTTVMPVFEGDDFVGAISIHSIQEKIMIYQAANN